MTAADVLYVLIGAGFALAVRWIVVGDDRRLPAASARELRRAERDRRADIRPAIDSTKVVPVRMPVPGPGASRKDRCN